MNRGDIYLVSLDPTQGHEQRGYRPVVVVSATEFNQVSRLAVVLPITTRGEFARRHGFAVPITGIETAGPEQIALDWNRFAVPGARESARKRRTGAVCADDSHAKTALVRCDQPRALDLAARNGRKVGALPQPILDEVLARTITLFE